MFRMLRRFIVKHIASSGTHKNALQVANLPAVQHTHHDVLFSESKSMKILEGQIDPPTSSILPNVPAIESTRRKTTSLHKPHSLKKICNHCSKMEFVLTEWSLESRL